MRAPIVIATLATGARDAVRIALDHHNGVNLVDVRACTPLTTTSGVMTPTAKGVSINVVLLPALIAGLVTAEARARELGMIGEGGQ